MKTNKQLYETIMSSVAKQVKKALNESTGDGWDLGDLDQLEEAFNEIERFMYEVRNCVRGAYSDCYTYAELAEKLRNIAESLAMSREKFKITLCGDHCRVVTAITKFRHIERDTFVRAIFRKPFS